MNYRVVMPRSVDAALSNRVQRDAWRRGYGTRLAGRASDGTIVEFLRLVDELPDPTEVASFATALDSFLDHVGANARMAPATPALWVETVTAKAQRREPRSTD